MFSSNTSQVSNDATYIEDVFSTYLYTGNGSTQTITNGIDLAGKGGLVWIGRRNTTNFNVVTDTVRGANFALNTYLTDAQSNPSLNWTFNADGFSQNNSFGGWNASGSSYCAWTFRKQPKFFDVVTYTGNGTAGRTIAHNLGAVPGCVIYKQTSASGENWGVYHRSLPANNILWLNTTNAQLNLTNRITALSSTDLTIGSNDEINANGASYVMYLFAHDAGGFGLTGTDNVISCGSFTTDGSGNFSVNLGWEPQWVLFKATNAALDWNMYDNMRGMPASSGYTSSQRLRANTSGAESTQSSPNGIGVSATGFSGNPAALSTSFIYIAIRRGPMKTPTSGTSVFAVDNTPVNGSTTTPCYDSGFPVDLGIRNRTTGANHFFVDRLRGSNYLLSDSTAAETDGSPNTVVNGYQQGFYGYSSESTVSGVGWMFRRAPGFFDEVCYTGTGSARTVTHNLGVAPELMIVKNRSSAVSWFVYSAALGNDQQIILNSNGTASGGTSAWNNTSPTASVFSVGATGTGTNASGSNYVAYLFASCPGVSKVGSYTGTGATLTISCGFAARFVLIKRTEIGPSNWVVWDTARGMVAGTDPRLELNTTNAETNANWVYTNASGFQIVTTDATVNASGGSYIYLAIA